MTDARAPIILASASPRRRELLAQMGIECHIIAADVDESVLQGEVPGAHVRRLARAKVAAVMEHPQVKGRPVLGADTIVVLDGRILGKPGSASEAASMLATLSGRIHQVMTAVAVSHDGLVDDRLSVTNVSMRTVDAAEIAGYVATGEPFDKAGGYGIQGRAAAFVDRIEGSYTGVVGLPLFETLALLAAVGIRP